MNSVDWEQIDRNTVEIWNNGRFDLVDQVVAPDYVRHDPAFPEEVRGPEGYKRYVKALMEPFPDGKIIVEDVILGPSGDKAAIRWTWRATHTADFMGIPPTGKRVELAGLSIVRAENGKLVECWDGYDSLSLMRQLGAVP
jgi:steroid delta-isomerase-like uncharacterized protein